MKKVLLLVAAVATSALVFGQELVSKKGEAYLPQEGDYALGFDAVPLFNVLKFNNNATIGNQGPSEYGAMSVFYKRFTSNTEACREGVVFSWGSTRTVSTVTELDNGAATNDQVEDISKTSNFNVTLVLGKEYRRGTTRLQGLWGAEGLVNLNSNRSKNELGNDYEDLTPAFLGTTIESKSGLGFGVGARAFVGVEYFVAPKLSIGLEAGLGLMFNISPKGKTTTLVDDGNGGLEEEENDGATRSSSFGVATNHSGGSVKMLFHF